MFLAALTLAAAAVDGAQEVLAPVSDPVQAAIDRGVAYLRSVQEADGSFGAPRNVMFNESFATFHTYEAWTYATTGLCAMALADCGSGAEDEQALDRAVDYLLASSDLKRVSEWDTDNVWGYVYGLQALAHLLRADAFADDPRRGRMVEVADGLLVNLWRWQTPEGGWGYYEGPVTSIPNTWATQFTTAACVVGLLDAKEAGLEVDERRLAKAIDAVDHCRLPNGSYTYSVDTIPSPEGLEFIHQVKGALGRIQVGNAVLRRAGRLDARALHQGLEQFFEHHRFLAVARKKPIPHESWYAIAAYFFLFGHYYAAHAIELLPEDQRAPFAEQLQQKLLEIQEPGGSFWDFHISEYTRAYGTAFAVMTLDRARRSVESEAPPAGR